MVLPAIAALSLLAAPATAVQTQTDADQPSFTPRLRFGLSLVSGVAELSRDSNGLTPIAALFGVEARAGAQLTQRLAVLYQGSFTLLWGLLRNSALVEWTACDYFSAAVGLGLDWLPGVTSGAGGTDHALSAGVPVRVAFLLPASRRSDGRRVGPSLGVTVTPEYTFDTGSSLNFHPGVGVEVTGGIGFELY